MALVASSSPSGSQTAEVIIPPALAEQHLVEPGGCRPGEDSLGAVAEAPLGAVRTSRQAQPGQVAQVAEGGK